MVGLILTLLLYLTFNIFSLPDFDAKTDVSCERQYNEAGYHDCSRHNTPLTWCQGGGGRLGVRSPGKSRSSKGRIIDEKSYNY